MLTNIQMPGGASGFGLGGFTTAPSPAGAVLFVNSAKGVDSKARLIYIGAPTSVTAGSTLGPQSKGPDFPLASVFGANGALAYCSAGRGDLIVVLPGHAENIATAVSVPAGVTIVGCGYGRGQRPTFTFTADVAITLGAGVQLNNLVLEGTGVASVTTMTIVNGNGCQMVNCLMHQNAAVNGAVTAITLNATADDFVFTGGEIDGTGAGAVPAQGVLTAGVVNRVEITNCTIHGSYSAACVVAANANGLKELIMENCTLRNLNAVPTTVLSLGTGSTGTVSFSTLFTANVAATVATIVNTPASANLAWFQVFGLTAGANANKNGILAPAAAAALP